MKHLEAIRKLNDQIRELMVLHATKRKQIIRVKNEMNHINSQLGALSDAVRILETDKS